MTKFDELVAKLEELFKLDKADLDFGIHRIIKQKHVQIKEYLHKRLPEKVKTLLEALINNTAQERLDTMRRECQYHFGFDAFEYGNKLRNVYAETPLGKRYALTLEEAGKRADPEQTELEVYSHLYEFFSRYYDNADFLSLRRSGNKHTYSVPYNGEEVLLHWANKDQYYIKSSETMNDYTFNIEENNLQLRVKFKLTKRDAVQNNNKAARAFVIDEEKEIEEHADTVVIPFHFKEFARKPTEKQMLDNLESTLEAKLPEIWKKRLWQDDPAFNGKDSRTVLRKHLVNYTKKSTSDFFIHKNLGAFLNNELDFYIKNEVMHLDDLDDMQADYLEDMINKIKAIRLVAKDIIAFLAQFEDFQKKLWLKKKFVIETGYCITLDRIAQELYPQIIANDRQREEWVKLFAIDEIQAEIGQPGYSSPLSVEFLKTHPYLVLDTVFFDEEFKYKVLAAIDDFDEQCDGLLIHSENFQALNLLQERYRKQVKCVYIDPPYNTGNDDFPYKDGYQISSWYSMMLDRVYLASRMMNKAALFFLQIGDNEAARSRLLLESIFEERKNSVVVRRGIKNVQAQFSDIERLNSGHDIIHVCSIVKGCRVPHLRHKLKNGKPGKWDTFWRGTDRPTMRYKLLGHKPDKGQWRWEENRTRNAVSDYKYFLDKENNSKTLDEWWVVNLQSGVDLDFVRLNNDGVVQYYVPPQDFRLVSDNWLDIPASGQITDFPHEKSIPLLQRVIRWNTQPGDIILDFFGGCGSTGHAACRFGKDLNRKFIIMEMGDYFDKILKPRIIRAVYAKSWKNSKPTTSNSGISCCIKYLHLESYEDTLNNLTMEDRKADLLGLKPDVQEEYLLNYMLDIETRGSLLNIEYFENPFDCTLKIYNRETGEAEPKKIDIPETFNYLLGLTVCKIRRKDDFLFIQGKNPAGETVLVIWRNVKEKDNSALEEFVTKTLQIDPADTDYKVIYINGDTTLNDPHQKIMLTEEVFHNLMFDQESL